MKNNDQIKDSLKIFGAIFGVVGVIAAIDKIIDKSGVCKTSKSSKENTKIHERKYK